MDDTRIVNLTGHPLVLGFDHSNVRFKSEGRVRIEPDYIVDETIKVGDGVHIPVLVTSNGEAVSLPDQVEGTLIVVSGLVAGRVRRRDVVAPARLHKLNGRVEYARALMRYKKEQ